MTALRSRRARFLDLVDRAIYRQPGSPYRALLQHVGCELGDLRRAVAHDGLEPTLRDLAARGVYVTDDELRGRTPIVRGSLTLTPAPKDFRNPLISPHVVMYTGGSSGRPGKVLRSLDTLADTAKMALLVRSAHRALDYRAGLWQMNPATVSLYMAKLGARMVHWGHPASPLPLPVRMATRYVGALMSRAGHSLPRPIPLRIEVPPSLARLLEQQVREHGPIELFTTPSLAVRAAVAAAEHGFPLTGVLFNTRGEPLTEARRLEIEAADAQVVGLYGSMELTYVSATCPAGASADDGHLWAHWYAAITRRRAVANVGIEVDALLVSTLSPHAAVIGLNAEMGDSADLRDGGSTCCELGALGLTTRVSNIRGFDKLTGEGMTVARSRLLNALELDLPARFGGSSIDYQIVEEQGGAGLTRVVLLAHPRLGALDEGALRDAILAELDRGDLVDRHMAAVWRQRGTVDVRRAPPRATARGKVLPFYFDRAGRA